MQCFIKTTIRTSWGRQEAEIVVTQESNKDVEQGIEQDRTNDGRTRSRTRSNNDVEHTRTKSNKCVWNKDMILKRYNII